jgi:hypothetical protein
MPRQGYLKRCPQQEGNSVTLIVVQQTRRMRQPETIIHMQGDWEIRLEFKLLLHLLFSSFILLLFSFSFVNLNETHRLAIIDGIQPVKNCCLRRLIANLSRQNLSSDLTVFIVFQQCLLLYNSKKYPVLVTGGNLPCLVFESSNTFLTYT